jgi:hypothetical protein
VVPHSQGLRLQTHGLTLQHAELQASSNLYRKCVVGHQIGQAAYRNITRWVVGVDVCMKCLRHRESGTQSEHGIAAAAHMVVPAAAAVDPLHHQALSGYTISQVFISAHQASEYSRALGRALRAVPYLQSDP